MGAKCCKDTGDATDNDLDAPPVGEVRVVSGEGKSAVVVWEERQAALNLLVLEKMREDFHNRPDNFILNLLVVSVQFYKNYGREKAEVANHIRDRETGLSSKMTSSKRKIMYLGGLEEISGTHALYLPRGEECMELPNPLQVFVVQDNVEVYSEDQYEELQRRNYTDVDGPAYRFCPEFTKRHLGYMRLRCADIIPGMSRNNTYEDIYKFMPPADEEKPDPVVDLRPLRRHSTFSSDGEAMAPQTRPPLLSISSFEEEAESEGSSSDEATPPPPTLMGRRPSGVLPNNYPTKPNGIIRNGFPGAQTSHQAPSSRPPHSSRLMERRPSGVFPKMNPTMDRLRVTSEQRKRLHETGNNLTALKQILAGIEEASEEEEEEEEQQQSHVSSMPKDELPVPTSELNTQQEQEEVPEELPILDASLKKDCFLNRKIKLRVEGDVYGLNTRSELRTYFSSERYLECFEDDFETLAKILGKAHLVDTSQMQTPAILANELMIEGIGPRFNTEFIPTIPYKEWPSIAFEYKLRERKTRADPETKLIFRWPKESTLQNVTSAGCNLVPIGHYNPQHPNAAMKIEWQIQFTKAEQILLRSLGHTHIRLLLLMEFLVRDHMSHIPGLKTQHLRFVLYWMCEHNFRDWQEERLGNKLKAYLKTLYNCLSSENLPHYFIDKCNMLETIPERYLRQIQSMVKKMKENLPMYLMHTMLRIRTEEDFYPSLNVRELYKILKPKKYSVAEMNPQLLGLIGGDDDASDDMLDDGEDVLYTDSEEEREHINTKEQLHALRKQRKLAATRKSSDVRGKRRRSTINLEQKVHCVKDLRAEKVLSMFAEHFIDMAKASNKYRSYPQAYMYLLMAGNMATLLEETGNYSEAEGYRKEIEELNLASRGGIKDMLGTSWGSTDPYMVGSQQLYGSNWDLKKEQPLPSPPMHPSPVSGLKLPKHKDILSSSFSDLENYKRVELSKTESIESSLFNPMQRDAEHTKTISSSPEHEDNNGMVVFSDDDDEFASTDL